VINASRQVVSSDAFTVEILQRSRKDQARLWTALF